MIDEVQDMKELIEELRHDGTLTREQSFALYGRIATLYELSYLTSEEFDAVWKELPLTTEDVVNIRV